MPLCHHLTPLINAELAAGNTIREIGPAPGADPGARLVLFAQAFVAIRGAEPPLVWIDVNDPHWWKAEVRCTIHGDAVAGG